MTSINCLQYLNQIATFLHVPPGKITLDVYSAPTRTENGKVTKGFLNIVQEYLLLSKIKLFNNSNLNHPEVYQWLEYALIYILQVNSSQDTLQVLNELNSVLSLKTYFVSDILSIVDVVLYYMLQNIMENLTYSDKEKYLHISRWFDNMQCNELIRQKNKFIDFSTNYLSVYSSS